MSEPTEKKHKAHGAQRCSYDEYEYDKGLRAEEEIKSEVITELRDAHKKLLVNQQRTMEALIATQDLLSQSLDALRVYRTEVLDWTNRAIQRIERDRPPCTTTCTKHKWDTENGWQRAADESRNR